MRGKLFSPEYMDGVKQFMSFVKGKFSDNVEILCPCSRCLNQKYLAQALVKKHILMNGMDNSYTRWIHHGEDLNVEVIEHVPAGIVHCSHNWSTDGICVTEEDSNDIDPLEAFLGDLHTAAAQEDREVGENEDGDTESCEQDTFFRIAMKEAKCMLYPGCTKFSRFSFVVKLLHMKSLYRISNSAFTAILKLLAEAFPEYNTLPKSYNEAKSILKELGLGYESIHVCENNCVLFRKEFAKFDNCPVCSLSRWKDPERKKIPVKVLHHFPLVPRLKRMFATKEASEQAQWHKLKRQPSEKEMSHPADGEAWQDFDREYPDFADDAGNLRLGLATDGFNPFSEKNTKYSMWPIFVVPYKRNTSGV